MYSFIKVARRGQEGGKGVAYLFLATSLWPVLYQSLYDLR